MSISPIGAAGSSAAIPPAAKPESAERPGAPDHDNDSDNGAPAAVTPAKLTPGTVNLKA